MFGPFAQRVRQSVLARNAGWFFAGQGLSFVVQGFYFIVLARLLGTTQYGLLAGAVALVAVVSQYSTFGSGLLFLRYVSPDHSRFRLYWGNILLSILAAGSGACPCYQAVWAVGLWARPACPFCSLSRSATAYFAVGSARRPGLPDIRKNEVRRGDQLARQRLPLHIAVGMLVLLGRASAWQWAIASLAVSALCTCVAVAIVTRVFGLPSFSLSLLKRRLGEGFVFAISGSTTAVYNDIDKVVLSHFGMEQANGIYSMAYRVVNIGSMPILSIVAAAFPRFFREGVKGIAATVPMARQAPQAHRRAEPCHFGGHVRLCSDHSTSGRQVLCGVGQRAAVAVLNPVFPYLSLERRRCHRRRGPSEVSPGLAIDRCYRKPSPQPLSGAAVFLAWGGMGLPGNRRSTGRDELAGADFLSRRPVPLLQAAG